MVARMNFKNIANNTTAWDGRTSVAGLAKIGWKRHALHYLEEHCGQRVIIEDNTVLTAPFEIGDDVYIGHGCFIAAGAEIGNNVYIESGVRIKRNNIVIPDFAHIEDDITF